jgi:hypothetical protein
VVPRAPTSAATPGSADVTVADACLELTVRLTDREVTVTRMGRAMGHAERRAVRHFECVDGRVTLRGQHGEALVVTPALGRLRGPAIDALQRALDEVK